MRRGEPSRHGKPAPIPGGRESASSGGVRPVTREERNVVLFVLAGVALGSLPWPFATLSLPEPEREAEAPARVVDLFPIDLNRASPELLCELPGIGPAKARAIAALREERGGFARIEELDDVKGIGPRTVERLRDFVTVDAAEAGGRERERHRSGERTTGIPSPRARGPDLGPARAGEEAAEVLRGTPGFVPRDHGSAVGG